jgi:hypothetical protein
LRPVLTSHAELGRIAELLSRPVVVYEMEGEIIPITEEDLAVVRAQLVKPRSEEVVRELALAYKIAERESMVAMGKSRAGLSFPSGLTDRAMRIQ